MRALLPYKLSDISGHNAVVDQETVVTSETLKIETLGRLRKIEV